MGTHIEQATTHFRADGASTSFSAVTRPHLTQAATMSGSSALGVGDGTMPDVPMLDTPDYTDSESNPTGANSVAGDRADGRTKRWEGNALRKSMFGKKHDRLGDTKDDDTIRRFRYLLGLTDLFRHFIDTNPDPKIRQVMAEIDRQDQHDEEVKAAGNKRKGGAGGERPETDREGGGC